MWIVVLIEGFFYYEISAKYVLRAFEYFGIRWMNSLID